MGWGWGVYMESPARGGTGGGCRCRAGLGGCGVRVGLFDYQFAHCGGEGAYDAHEVGAFGHGA